MSKKELPANIESRIAKDKRAVQMAVERLNKATGSVESAAWKLAELVNATTTAEDYKTYYKNDGAYAAATGLSTTFISRSRKSVAVKSALLDVCAEAAEVLSVTLAGEAGTNKIGFDAAIMTLVDMYADGTFTVAEFRKRAKFALTQKNQAEEQAEEQDEEVSAAPDIAVYIESIVWDVKHEMYAGCCGGKVQCYIPVSVMESINFN